MNIKMMINIFISNYLSRYSLSNLIIKTFLKIQLNKFVYESNKIIIYRID